MTERDRIVLGMSDSELLIYHGLGGRVPPIRMARLERLLAGYTGEGVMVTPRAEMYAPPVVLPVMFVRRAKRVRRRFRNAA